jgi:UDP-galactopyranose mutase
MQKYDYLIVGAGFSGSVLARLLAEERKKVLLIDRRDHIGGNAYDYKDGAGVVIHKYGPHSFHTNAEEVWSFLSRFTQWHPYEHRVQACVDGLLVPFPITIDTINQLYGTSYTEDTIGTFYDSVRQRRTVRNGEDAIVNKIGEELFEKFYKYYTKKHWDLWPAQLDAEVLERIPIRDNRDNRYFTDKYQGIPKNGYTELFRNILSHPDITLRLETDFRELKDIRYENLIYTGCIDEYFGYEFGRLPYRSVFLEYETLSQEYFQPVAIVNYPCSRDFTRITEFKHFLGQKLPKTTIAYEYTSAQGEPSYPIPRSENRELYEKYLDKARNLGNVFFVGRLAEYRYYNMDQVVLSSLKLFGKLEIG